MDASQTEDVRKSLNLRSTVYSTQVLPELSEKGQEPLELVDLKNESYFFKIGSKTFQFNYGDAIFDQTESMPPIPGME